MSETPKQVAIVGAGLVGSLLAIALQRRGHHVTVFEKRSDMRKGTASAGKSINLIVTAKGMRPLVELGLWDRVKSITSPVVGRKMHSLLGEETFQPYGKDDSECNFSVSRAELNKLLMTEAENAGVKIRFSSSLQRADLKSRCLHFENSEIHPYEFLFGTDGVGSVVRQAITEIFGSEASYQSEPLGTDYKEMTMPARIDGGYAMDEKCLHIWPRGDHMLMGLPNRDGSFTMTLYMPKGWFAEFNSASSFEKYFRENYPDAVQLMPDFVNEFLSHPPGHLGIVRMRPWIYKNQVALLGDAAHAIVPFFGQGMNSGFADVHYLLQQMDFTDYGAHQKLEGDAIADMSLENFTEMCEKVGDEKFLLRKKVEHMVEAAFPKKFRSRYGLVTYTLVPYHLAKAAGVIQDQILDELCLNLTSAAEVDLGKAERLIDQKLVPWFAANKLSVERYGDGL